MRHLGDGWVAAGGSVERVGGFSDVATVGAVPAVFVFERDGDLHVFPSLRAAAAWLEAIDVDAGEYAAAFLHDGTVVELSTVGDDVVLRPAARDGARFDDLLLAYTQRTGRPPVGDAAGFANAWFCAEWERRWPQRPAWLSRRLHGKHPPQVTDDDAQR